MLIVKEESTDKLSADPVLVKPVNLNPGLLEKASRAVLRERVSPAFDAYIKLLTYRQMDRLGMIDLPYPYGADKYLKTEVVARDNQYLPTIGVELELPKDTVIYDEAIGNYQYLLMLGVSGDHEDAPWEFSLPYSYSWNVQALLIHTLLDWGFLPYTKNAVYGREVLSQSHFSLHCNLGIPEKLQVEVDNLGHRGFQADAKLLAVACGVGYTDIGRLTHRKTSCCYTTEKDCESSLKTDHVAENGRYEIRALGFGNRYSYSQLRWTQYLGVALFGAFQFHYQVREFSPDDYETYQWLNKIWQESKKQLEALLNDKYQIGECFDGNDDDILKLANILKNTTAQTETRAILSDVVGKVAKAIF